MRVYIPNLEEYLEHTLRTDPRIAAEVAYALAVLNKGTPKGRRYAQMCIELLQSIRIETLEDAAARFMSINGVEIPSLFHEGVVRARLGLQ